MQQKTWPTQNVRTLETVSAKLLVSSPGPSGLEACADDGTGHISATSRHLSCAHAACVSECAGILHEGVTCVCFVSHRSRQASASAIMDSIYSHVSRFFVCRSLVVRIVSTLPLATRSCFGKGVGRRAGEALLSSSVAPPVLPFALGRLCAHAKRLGGASVRRSGARGRG